MAVQELFRCAYETKTWLVGLPKWGTELDARRDRIRDEAMNRRNDCHIVWDRTFVKVDSLDLQGKMAQVDSTLSQVLEEMIRGNLLPDTSGFTHALEQFRQASNLQLRARL